MTRVFLADDEQLALSGVKYMLDWKSLDCEVVGTADNGQAALDGIRALRPDIVVCDIEMPVYTGVQLLEIFSESARDIVFIMLTNYQDFELLQSALHFNASDYLLKSGLKPEKLAAAIEKARQLHLERQQMQRYHWVQDYLVDHTQETLTMNLPLLMQQPGGSRGAEAAALCDSLHAFENFCLMHLYIHLEQIPSYPDFTPKDTRQVLLSTEDMIHKMKAAFFPKSVQWPGEDRSFYVFAYGLTEDWKEKIVKFQEKLLHIVRTITSAEISVLATGLHNGKEQFAQLQKEMNLLENAFFHHPQKLLCFEDDTPAAAQEEAPEWPPLEKMMQALAKCDGTELSRWFHELETCCALSALDRQTAVRHCTQAFQCIREGLRHSPVLEGALGDEEQEEVFLLQGIQAASLRQLTAWLEELRTQLLKAFENTDGLKRRDYLDLAKSYIQEHVEERLTLNDVSAAVHISPNYLSSLFMRQLSIGFVDYVNQIKMKRACELLEAGHYLIYEVANRLGYENAYYFSKVFRKYIGCTPKEYQLRSGKRNN